MIYKMQLKDTSDEMTFYLLETPIVDKDIEGAVDNTTLDGDVYTDYLWLKKQYVQKWAIMCEDEYSRLRGFYTRQFDEGTVPSYRLYYGTDVFSNLTAEGKRINFTITGIEAPMALDTIKGDTKQASYTGKNLFDNSSVDIGHVWNGSSNAKRAYGYIEAVQGQTYTVSANNQNNDLSIYVVETSAIGVAINPIKQTTLTDKLTFTPQTSTKYIVIQFSTTNNNVTQTAVDNAKVQLELGNQATTYEPYVGGIPSPNPSYPQNINTVTGRQTVTVTGKNLFDKDHANILQAGITATKIESATANRTLWIPCEPNTTYTIQKRNDGDTNRFNVATTVLEPAIDVAITNRTEDPNASSITYTTSATAKYLCVQYYRTAETTLTEQQVLDSIQIEYGNQATAYEAFRQQSQEINLGKNLFDKDNVNEVRGYIAGTNLTSGTDYTIFIPCEENTTYTISKMVAVPQTANRFRVNSYAVVPTGGATSISSSYFWNAGDGTATTSHAYTTPMGAKYLGVTVMTANTTGTTTASDMYASIQIEKGYDATTYASYFTPIELCKIGTYQDKIYKSGDKWYLHKEVGKVVFDGSENWSLLNSGTSNFYYNLPVYVTPKDQDIMPVSNYFVGTPITNGNTSVGLWITNAGTIRARKETEQTLADFKTWLGTALPSVYYVPATATDTEITDATLLAQLNHAYSLYIGENNILSVTPNLMPEIKIAYTEIFEKSTDVVPETPVRLTLTDDGVINACGCRRNVQLTMRETSE